MTSPPPHVPQPSAFMLAIPAGLAAVLVGGGLALQGSNLTQAGIIGLLAAVGSVAGLLMIWPMVRVDITRTFVEPPVVRPTAITADERRLASLERPGFATAALDAAPMPVVIIDSAWRLRAANLAARRRFGLTRPGVRADAQIRRPELIKAVTQVLADGQQCTLDFETAVPIEQHETATIARFQADGADYVLVTVIDGTEARRSERMRADFLANASHELRTPLASITGCIETLMGPARDDPASQGRFLTIMHEQAQRMGRLIADLLSLSRIEINEHVRPTAEFDLAQGVREAVEAISRSPRAAGVNLAVSGADQVQPVSGDWDQIQQLITNLIDNALKYGQKNGTIRISMQSGLSRAQAVLVAGRQWDDGARLPLTSPEPETDRLYAVIRVEDDGPGIDPQVLPRLSERFFRVEETAHLVPGTGLGLAIVKHILSRHRGGLIVETRPGAGTAFGVYLPQP
jgi:two-component system, OmpR family, phosphate regulon sensor histidine kinase PhoR